MSRGNFTKYLETPPPVIGVRIPAKDVLTGQGGGCHGGVRRNWRACGVYFIRGPRKRFYVGGSTDIFFRWKLHLRRLRRGKHDNRKMQEDWVKFGEKAFSLEIVKFCSVEGIKVEEQKHIDAALLTAFAYNISRKVGQGPLVKGDKLPEPWKAKAVAGIIRASRKPEARKVVSRRFRDLWRDPEWRQQMLAAQKKGREAAASKC